MATAGADTMVVHTYGSRGAGPVNTHWIESAAGVVVIDGQRQLSEARQALGAIAKTRKPIEALVLTHHHPDHVGGSAAFVKAFPRIRVLAAQGTIDSLRADEGGLLAFASGVLGADLAVAERIEPLPDEGHVIIGGTPFDVWQAGPGEASSTLVLYAPQARALFTGDLVSQRMTPYLVEQRTGAWLRQLDWLLHEFPGSCTAYPGHGAPAHLYALVSSTRDYLEIVRGLVAEARCGSGTLTPALRREVVAAIEARFRRYVPVTPVPDAIGMNVDGLWAELERTNPHRR
jgi:glyoxylase-like metal-dependent hydrolase (beta-lactamase superfamily II)